ARDDPRCACAAIGNFANEMTAFYVSAPNSLVFSDQAVANGLGPSTRLLLTFGVFFFDADLDGWDDIFHANGHLEEDIAKVQTSQTYEQSPQLFWNAGPDATTEYIALPPSSTGADLAKPMVGRGAAYADIDGDGDLDVLIAATGQSPRLLRNDQALGHHWLRIHLRGNGSTSNRDAIGAMIELKTKAGRSIHKIVNPTRSYLSQVELPITIGLDDDEVSSLEVTWPDGKHQSIEVTETDRLLEITQTGT
ncbi:MAG: CRTAC1 family protein, partial [Planctomycetaceae bacterium]